MYSMYNMYPCPYFSNTPMFNFDNMYRAYPCPYYFSESMYNSDFSEQLDNDYIPFNDEIEYASRCDSSCSDMRDDPVQLKDYGPKPFVVNINEATKQNNTYRTALWTGKYLQVTLMSIKPGESIGLEIHPNVDQFLRVEDGQGTVKMGARKDRLNFQKKVSDDFAIMIPAGTWHDVINTGNKPLKMYSIYAPPQHPSGTVHKTKADAEAAEKEHGR
ncbi:cupin domain-containing protein [Clostridium sp. OS1-26]|uniref:cupin domain-containing protein n=1 Tax=Clostridium sp. OS1-26 TaxID=3070681 RepID=UPI0027DF9B4C|nr:cupin domain-containing protein [Clostridium sp. OS1-26]WML34421.1 cupin domain-containing protein [Clostridium sp. OS1-26]